MQSHIHFTITQPNHRFSYQLGQYIVVEMQHVYLLNLDQSSLFFWLCLSDLQNIMGFVFAIVIKIRRKHQNHRNGVCQRYTSTSKCVFIHELARIPQQPIHPYIHSYTLWYTASRESAAVNRWCWFWRWQCPRRGTFSCFFCCFLVLFLNVHLNSRLCFVTNFNLIERLNFTTRDI